MHVYKTIIAGFLQGVEATLLKNRPRRIASSLSSVAAEKIIYNGIDLINCYTCISKIQYLLLKQRCVWKYLYIYGSL